MLEKDLQNAGFTANEARVYLAALELGETTIVRISKKTGIKRTTTYLVADSLIEKGLMSSIKKAKKTLFYAEDPRKIEEKLDERKAKISKIMPEILSIANFIDKKPKIRYFEGKEGLTEAFRDILQFPEQEVKAMYSDTYKESHESFFNDYFIPERLKKKIWVRVIMPDNEHTRMLKERDHKDLRKGKIVTNEKFKLGVDIDIYGKDRVSIISYKENIGIVIESKDIHDSMEGIFETMWDLLPEK